MKIPRTSADTARLNCIVEMATALVQIAERNKYSFGIEFALAELVREQMRVIAQQERRFPAGQLLALAVERVTGKVEAALRQHQVEINLSKYSAKVREKLKFPAQEIQSLAEKLSESRHIQKLGAKQDVVSESGRHFIVHELGLREAIQGILVEPTEECQEMNIDLLREQPHWRVEGEWFPYEVFVDEFVFVVDDDGSVFVSTANLPFELRQRASGLIRRIAELLYNP